MEEEIKEEEETEMENASTVNDDSNENKANNEKITESDKTTTTKPKRNSKKGKKKKKVQQILYAEDATKLFKKINDGKRLKNGITLSKACNIFSVAWELPEENGRILPSKVARHFKQVLPSKKTAKKTNTRKRGVSNIKPSVAKARTHRDNPIATMRDAKEEKGSEYGPSLGDITIKPRTMRGDAKSSWTGLHSQTPHTLHALPRASARVAVSPHALRAANNFLPVHPNMEPKRSIVTTLEKLIEADANRSNPNDNEKSRIIRDRAGTMTDLQNMLEDLHDDDHDQVVETEIDVLFQEVKKQKALEQKKKEQENDAANAIDAALGLGL